MCGIRKNGRPQGRPFLFLELPSKNRKAAAADPRRLFLCALQCALEPRKTFHNVFVFTTPAMAPVLVEHGHLLIGLSLLFGFMVQPSALS
jgi:hypothetical protein